MNRRQIALKLALDDLAITPDLSTFDGRLALQKAVYLAQQMGVPFAYRFSWYLRGPYSSELTADAFGNVGMQVPAGWSIPDGIKAKLTKTKQLLDAVRQTPHPVRELEKLASVLFVVKTGQASASETEKITARMKLAGKKFGLEDVNDAVRTLRGHGLITEETENRR